MIIYLNGTSSSGKTSIANELQAIKGKRPYRQKLNWEAIFEGYFSCVAALANTGNNIIADCPVYSEGIARYFSKHLDIINKKFVVKIDCPLSVLEDRERVRGDRAIGVARGQFEGIHQHLNFDLEVDSSKQTPDEIASIVSLAIKGPY